MEQLTNPKALIETATRQRETAEVSQFIRYREKSDPSRCWIRLNEATISQGAPCMAEQTPQVQAAIDLLRCRVLRQIRKDGIRKLALTSPTAGCGTTTLATQLALSLARQTDLKVMIFDFDLHAPKLAERFGQGAVAQRHSALTGLRREFDSTCLRVDHNLALSLAADTHPHPAELLANTRSRALVEQIEREFEPDLMIFDMPPVLRYDDVVAASDLFDAALLVARADHSTIDQIDRAERLISEQKPCLGVIMNACRFPTHVELGDERAA